MPTKQKSGLYRARVKIGVDENGKDLYKYISGKSKKELEANRQRVIQYYIEGTAGMRDMLFAPYAIQWYHVHKEPDIKPATRSLYRSMLNKYVLPAFGDRQLRAISPTDVKRFLGTFSEMSSTQTVTAKAILNGVFRLACEEQIITRNPMAMISSRIPSNGPVRPKRALTIDERARIVKACLNNSDALYIALLYYLGVRRGEAAGLRWSDVDWVKCTVRVERNIDRFSGNQPASPKTASSVRTVPAPKPLMYLLNKQRGMPDVYILHGRDNKPLNSYQLDRIWQSIIVDLCNITDITPHALRHNYITLCWENGIDVYATARFVGHASVATTLNIYTHLSAERELESARAVRRVFSK